MFTIAIVGRPNVGKSTLFNRLIESNLSIVDDVSGVTRDRIFEEAEWNGRTFNLIDTGGVVPDKETEFERHIKKQVDQALTQSDAIFFVVDATQGATSWDEYMEKKLRSTGKPVFLVVNKSDNFERRTMGMEFYKFGMDRIYFVSSISGSGTGELLDDAVKLMPEEVEAEKIELPKIALIGQPNVGKSTLLNSLIGEERSIVTATAGTTRDAIHTEYNLFGQHFVLIDTAGLRKKNRSKEDVEFYSVIRTVKAMDEADVCLILIDATQGISAQDINIFSLAVRKGKGVMIIANKWDLVEKDHKTALEFTKAIELKIAPFTDVPILFISAIDKTRIFKTVETALEIYKRRQFTASTSKLNEWLKEATDTMQPPVHRGKNISIKYVTQVGTHYPVIAFFCNHPESVTSSYKQFLENHLRKTFNLKGVPTKLLFKSK